MVLLQAEGMTNDQAPMTNTQWLLLSLVIGAWSLGLDAWRRCRTSPALDIVYQMRNQLCQLLLQEAKNLFGPVQAAAGRELLQTKRPVKHRMGPKISHGTLDRVGRSVQQLPVRRVDRPTNFIDSPR